MACLRRLQRLIPAALWLLLISACGDALVTPERGASVRGTSVADSSTPTSAGPTDAAPLAGTRWVLAGYGPVAQPRTLPAGAQVMAEFTADQVQGTAACNHYFGSYTVDGPHLTIRELGQTEAACLREDLMALERMYLQALNAATGYALAGDTLTIDYDGGVLTFARSMPPATLPLEGISWELTAFGTGQVVSSLFDESRITAEFTQGRISGSTGCNSYSGSYTVQETALAFGAIVATRRGCTKELTAQERVFLEALRTAHQATRDGRELRIDHAAGTLYFTAEQSHLEAGTTTP